MSNCSGGNSSWSSGSGSSCTLLLLTGGSLSGSRPSPRSCVELSIAISSSASSTPLSPSMSLSSLSKWNLGPSNVPGHWLLQVVHLCIRVRDFSFHHSCLLPSKPRSRLMLPSCHETHLLVLAASQSSKRTQLRHISWSIILILTQVWHVVDKPNDSVSRRTSSLVVVVDTSSPLSTCWVLSEALLPSKREIL